MSKRDMRRADLVVPYLEPATQKSDMDISGTFTSTLPMAAIFTRSKLVGWTAVTFAVQTWLAETAETKKNSSTPGIFAVGMAFMSLGISYMQLFMPPVAGSAAGAGVAMPSAAP